MSLVYFDGFDQYAKQTAPTTAAPYVSTVGTFISSSVATDVVPFLMNANKLTFVKMLDDDHTWICPSWVQAAPNNGTVGSPTVGIPGYIFNSEHLGQSLGLNNQNLAINALKPISETEHLTIGYKQKLYANASQGVSSSRPHLLAAFSTKNDPDFGIYANCFGVTLEGQSVWVRPVGRPGVIGPQCGAFTGAFPANTFVEQVPGGVTGILIGTTNYIWTTSGNLKDLASNTVEIQITKDGKLTVWINNLFVGSLNFTPNSWIGNIQHVKINALPQFYQPGQNALINMFIGATDLYVLNGLGTRNNTRLGKVKVVSRLPTTDVSVAFTRPDTQNSNSAVASQVPPANTPSLTGLKEGDTDLYSSGAFAFTNEAIIATAVTTTGFKTDPSGNDIAPVLAVTGTKYVGDNNSVPISQAQMKQKQHIYEVNPKTGLPFTKTDLDATTFGVTVVAPKSS